MPTAVTDESTSGTGVLICSERLKLIAENEPAVHEGAPTQPLERCEPIQGTWREGHAFLASVLTIVFCLFVCLLVLFRRGRYGRTYSRSVYSARRGGKDQGSPRAVLLFVNGMGSEKPDERAKREAVKTPQTSIKARGRKGVWALISRA
jgi:hypothetical protein